MGENLLQIKLMNYMKIMELKDSFQLQELHSRMGLLKEKIEQSKKLPEQCLMKQNYQIIFGEKLYKQLSTHSTNHKSE